VTRAVLPNRGVAVRVEGVELDECSSGDSVMRLLYECGAGGWVGLAVEVFVVYGDSFVEDVAGTLPLAGFGRDNFEVFEDAAFEVIDLGEALLEHVGRGCFAADAAGAEHGDLAVFGWVEVFADVVREGVERWSDGVGEGADRGLVGVARIEEEDLGVGEEGVPLVRFDVLVGSTVALRKVMISRLSLNLRRRKGGVSVVESLPSERLRPVRSARKSRRWSMVGDEPAMVPLMPSGAMSVVP
jgi:hypothetical protein